MSHARLLLLAAAVAAGCGGMFASHQTPPKPGPDGIPVFEGNDFRHPAGTPFHCYRHVTGQGDNVSSCHEIKEWCASELQKTHDSGLSILDGCQERTEATCLTFYRGDATKTVCTATPEDCDLTYRYFTSPDYGATPEQLTRCTTIDTSFQPAQ